MLDHSLEQKLGAALRAEGDDLPFTITAEELERRLVLRRRGGLSPLASLGLAAAVGVGLLGLAGVVGGWFDPPPVVVPPSPSPSAIAIASASPSPSSTPSSGPIALPALDDLLATVDPARVVRAEAVGPYASIGDQNAENFTPIQRGSVTFDPVASSGSYDVLAVCAGEGDIDLEILRAGDGPPEDVPITCDGVRSLRQMGLEAGDALKVASTGQSGWRVVLLAPDRAAPHAAAIEENVDPAGADVLVDARSASDVPSYAALQTGGGIATRTPVGPVPSRDRYDVYISCAGPSSIRYAVGEVRPVDAPVAPELIVDFVSGQVECDGTLQHDTLNLALDGANVFVQAEDRVAWRIVVTSAQPPISLPADNGGWRMSTAFGPDYRRDGQAGGIGLIGPDDLGPVRVVIDCFGDGTLTGMIDVGGGTPVDPFSLDCNIEHDGAGELTRTYAKASAAVDISYDPHGTAAWLAVTTQTRVPATAAP